MVSRPKRTFQASLFRGDPELHAAATLAAVASGESLNQWVVDLIKAGHARPGHSVVSWPVHTAFRRSCHTVMESMFLYYLIYH